MNKQRSDAACSSVPVEEPDRPWCGEDELRKWLESQGFRIAKSPLGRLDNECNWYAYHRSELDARACECNYDKPGMQIVVTPYAFSFDGRRHSSAEVELCGEAGGIWWKLRAYSLSPDQVPERLAFVEPALIAAWNALLSNAKDSGSGTASAGMTGWQAKR